MCILLTTTNKCQIKSLNNFNTCKSISYQGRENILLEKLPELC